MNGQIRFGPSGNSDIFYEQGYQSTWQAPQWLSQMGLSAMEYSFGRGVRLGEEAAKRIQTQAQVYQIQLSVHMPYFINLATMEEDKKQRNVEYFLQSLQAARWLGAVRAVFHPGSASKQDRGEALKKAKALLKTICNIVDEAGYADITMCPETMGKINQLGDLEEVIALCGVDERLLPCIDFGHLHCRGLGAIQGKEDYRKILDRLESGVGVSRAKHMHVHFSRIEYTAGGEKMHHRFIDTQYGPEFPPLAELLLERQYLPVLICESKGTMAEDAKTMLEIYQNLQKTRDSSE